MVQQEDADFLLLLELLKLIVQLRKLGTEASPAQESPKGVERDWVRMDISICIDSEKAQDNPIS
jgi:hypothetical protein